MKTSLQLSLLLALLFSGCATQFSAKWRRPIDLKTKSPLDQVVVLGGTARFTVSSRHRDGVIYQWLHGTNIIRNATNRTLTVSNISSDNAGYYRCVAYTLRDMEVSQPMQLITMERTGPNAIVLGARSPIGLGDALFLDNPLEIESLQKFEIEQSQKKVARDIRRARQSPNRSMPEEQEDSSSSGAVAPAFANSLTPVSQLALMMQIYVPGNTPYISSSSGTSCPRPYSGYVRFTAGWYPQATGPWIAASSGWVASAIIADDLYRSACAAGASINLGLSHPGWTPPPVTTRLHKFVGYFPPGSPPNPSTTYFLSLTGF